MKRTTLALTWSALVSGAGIIAPSAMGEAGAKKPPELAGTTWHTISIDGDALFFVIKEFGVRFEKDGRFAARVRYVDGQQTVRAGTYRVANGSIIVSGAGGNAPNEVQYWADGSSLMVRDKAFDVTARLEPGQMTEESWF